MAYRMILHEAYGSIRHQAIKPLPGRQEIRHDQKREQQEALGRLGPPWLKDC